MQKIIRGLGYAQLFLVIGLLIVAALGVYLVL